MMEIRTTEAGALTVSQRNANAALRQEFHGIGELWHKKHRKRHFTLDGVRRYDYTPRKRSYNKRKRAKYRHTLPLVLTGESKRRSSQVSNLRGTTKGVSITMPVNTFNFKPPNSTVNMLREFRTISSDEINTYENQMQRNLDRRIRRHRKQQERYG